MKQHTICSLLVIAAASVALWSAPAGADGNLHKVNHIIIVMQENHSFDNYFGALAYDPSSLYHNGNGACAQDDHTCIDGLSDCMSGANGFTCTNSNVESDGSEPVSAFHDPSRCVIPDLDHEWAGSHYEANFDSPNESLASSPNDGFVRQNDRSTNGQQDPPETQNPPDDETMGFYTQDDIPFYYSLAENFAIDDRYFGPVLGATIANRFYLMAGTSFGHLNGNETVQYNLSMTPPTTIPYKPINGTIFDLLDQFDVSWTDYYSDFPESVSFVDQSELSTKAQPIKQFFVDAKTKKGLPKVAFVESASGFPCISPGFPPNCGMTETDEHPPTDIQRGQNFVSNVVNAVRNGPNWKDSIIFITYDEHGGFYDHVPPPAALQGGASTPDGIGPGQCADLSDPAESEQLGHGANCPASVGDARLLCPSMTPTGPFPADCATFDQYGFRVPFIAVSPFSKPHYVSHTVGDHTSILALIEKRFFVDDDVTGQQTFLTLRDQNASTLEDMFDFNHSPSLNTSVPDVTPLPADDCTP